MTAPRLLEFGGFRAHLLYAGEFVGTIINGRPTFRTLELDGSVFRYRGVPLLDVFRVDGTARTVVRVRALTAGVWLQEPGLTIRVAGAGEWRGFGIGGHWTPTTAGVDRWLPLDGPDAYRATVHWSRIRELGPGKRNPGYTVGVAYRSGPVRWRFRSSGGFRELLEGSAPAPVPWEGCRVFGHDWRLTGTVSGLEQFRRWELARHGDEGWLHFFGWTGGAGAVVNRAGRTPPPGSSPGPADGYTYLWNPRSWRELKPGASIEQTVTAEWGPLRPT